MLIPPWRPKKLQFALPDLPDEIGVGTDMFWLLSIAGGSDLGLFEINEAARLVQNVASTEANIIFGAVIDDTLGDEVRVTVIAAGFADKDLASVRRSSIHAVANSEPEIPSFVAKSIEDTGPQPVIGSKFNATTASTPDSAWVIRRFPSKLNGFVTTPIVRAPTSLATLATTGAPPVPVPPPSPAVTNKKEHLLSPILHLLLKDNQSKV